MTRTSARRSTRTFGVHKLLVLVVALASVSLAPAQGADQDATWVPTLPLATQGRAVLSPLSDGSVILSHNSGFVVPPLLARSRDGGMTWTPMPLPPEPQYGTTRFATPTLGYSTGSMRVYISENGGLSWSRSSPLPSDGGPPSAYRVSVVPGTQKAYVLGGAYGPLVEGCNPVDETIWTTNDAGEHWRRFSFGQQQPSFVTALDTKRAVAIVHAKVDDPTPCETFVQPDTNTIWLTDDGGTTWRKVHRCRTHCTSAAYVSRSRIVLGHNDGSITYTSNGGRRWVRGQTLRQSPDTHYEVDAMLWVQSMDFVDDRIGYASTKGGATWRTTDGGVTWRSEVSHEAVYPGFSTGEVAALSRDRAVIAGPTAVAVRQRVP